MHRLEKNILHHANKRREQRKYLNKGKYKFKIFEGVDHFNNKPLYKINGINNDHVGEWHTTKESLYNELNAL